MGKKAHIICAKCGSDDMHFEMIKEPYECPTVYLSCGNCSELTSTDEWNEFNPRNKDDKNEPTD